ncbi:MAG: gliding motility-associated C-terminal domain-containing protein [Bacteroidetes bacterium]|nr:gliding motility-associated C-terminal domain-containing protein [Bacteroidota bacterium]
MKQKYLALLAAFTMLTGYNSSAQFSSVASVDAGADKALCGTRCFNLSVNLSDIRATDSYIIDSSIDYNKHYDFYIPGSGSVPAENNLFSEAIRLPFTFCFYGKPYNSVAIGSNGIISFDDQSIGKRCDPIIKNEIPSRSYAYAAIMPAYEALDLSVGGSIYYATVGTAPNRRFIVNYNNIPLRTCSIDNATFQVVLYETTNIVEIYIKDKPSCLYYYDGAAISGIQNGRKEALALPGKNATRWGSAGMNAAYRFIPNGEPQKQTVQLSDIEGRAIAAAPAANSANGQLSAYFDNICLQGDNGSYVVSTTYRNCNSESTCADTLNVTTSTDCNTKEPEPVRSEYVPPRDEANIVKNDMPVSNPGVIIGRISTVNPTTCLGINGFINVHGLSPNTTYTIEYARNGVMQKARTLTANAAGALSLSRLSAGTYSDIKVSTASAGTTEPGPFVLKDPELPAAPVPESNSPVNPGEKLKLSVSNEDRVSYTWLGPGFATVSNSPTILNAQPYNSGKYTVIATRNGCNSQPASFTVVVNKNGGVPNLDVPVRIKENGRTSGRPTPVLVAKQKSKPPPLTRASAQGHPLRIAAGSNSPVYSGATLRLHSTAISGATYSWNGPNDFSSNAQNPALNDIASTASGVYTLTVSTPDGHIRSTHVTVVVKENLQPMPSVKATPNEEPEIFNGVTASATDPYVRNGHDGVIALSGLLPSTTYKVYYDKDGKSQPMKYFTTDAKGTLLIMWLSAGSYTNIYAVSLKGGRSNKVSAVLGHPGYTIQPQVHQAKPAVLPATIKPEANVSLKKTATPVIKTLSAQNGAAAPVRIVAEKPAPSLADRIKERHEAEASDVVKQNSPSAEVTPAPATVPAVEPAPQPVQPSEEEPATEYRGIVISADQAEVGETIKVSYDDPIRDKDKIRWHLAKAVVVSGTGTGADPYVLRWNEPGVKTISLVLPYNIPGYGKRLRKDILVNEPIPQPMEETQQPEVVPSAKQESAITEPVKVKPAPITAQASMGRVSSKHQESTEAPVEKTVSGRVEPAAAEPVAVTTQASMGRVSMKQERTPRKHEPTPAPVPETVKLDLVISKSNVCLNDIVSISVNGNVDEDAEMKWDFNGGDIISGTGAGPYEVRWDEEGAKKISLSVSSKKNKAMLDGQVNVLPAPKAEFAMAQEACPGEKVNIGTSTKYRNEQCTWDFDGADIISGDDGGPYEVKWEQAGKKVVSLNLVDENGCSSLPYRAIINVEGNCCNVGIPTAFTPNGDGKNDVFHVLSVAPVTLVRLEVRNRFDTQVLFSTNNDGQGWDGTYKGVPQDPGTYLYRVRYRCGDKFYEKDGEVQLLR